MKNFDRYFDLIGNDYVKSTTDDAKSMCKIDYIKNIMSLSSDNTSEYYNVSAELEKLAEQFWDHINDSELTLISY